MVISDVKQGKDYTKRGHRRSLGTNRRQGSKKFLVAVIESRLEAVRSESVLESMPELVEIILESFPR